MEAKAGDQHSPAAEKARPPGELPAIVVLQPQPQQPLARGGTPQGQEGGLRQEYHYPGQHRGTDAHQGGLVGNRADPEQQGQGRYHHQLSQDNVQAPGPEPLPGVIGPHRSLRQRRQLRQPPVGGGGRRRGLALARTFRPVPGRGRRRQGRLLPVAPGVQLRIGHAVPEKGTAQLRGPAQPLLSVSQQLLLPLQSLPQRHLSPLHRLNSIQRHIQLPEKADLLQGGHILRRIVPVVVAAPGGGQQPLPLVVTHGGPGKPQLLLNLPDGHRLALLFPISQGRRPWFLNRL